MAIRVVLGLVDGGPASEAAAEASLRVADEFGAHLQLLHVRPDPESLVPMIGEGMSGVMLERLTAVSILWLRAGVETCVWGPQRVD